MRIRSLARTGLALVLLAGAASEASAQFVFRGRRSPGFQVASAAVPTSSNVVVLRNRMVTSVGRVGGSRRPGRSRAATRATHPTRYATTRSGASIPGYGTMVDRIRTSRKKADRAMVAGRYQEAAAFYGDVAERARRFYGASSGHTTDAARRRERALAAAAHQVERAQLASARPRGSPLQRADSAYASGDFEEALGLYADALTDALRDHGPASREVRRVSRGLDAARAALLQGPPTRIVD